MPSGMTERDFTVGVRGKDKLSSLDYVIEPVVSGCVVY